MDLLKTLLVYMMMMVSTSAQLSPGTTPLPPQALVTPTPVVTFAPQWSATATPTAVASTGAYAPLYVGDRGDNVRKMQTRLAVLGYLTDTIDGIYGQNTKRAVESFQRRNGLNADGIAGRQTLTVLYDSPNVIPAYQNGTAVPTGTPAPQYASYVNVPVYYYASNGVLLYRTTQRCAAGANTVYAVDSYVPAGYALQNNRVSVVTVSNGVASPSVVTFIYAASSVTPTPTVSPYGASVVVYYRDTGGKLLNQTVVPVTGTTWLYPNAALVPTGYSLVGDVRKLVSVSGGVAAPAYVTFTYYRQSIATATPTSVPQSANVTVYYRDVSGSLLNYAQQSVPYGGVYVYPNSNYVPSGYRLVGSTRYWVASVNGAASPATVTFTYQAPTVTAAPTQAPTAGYVTVYYRDAYGSLLNRETRSVNVGGGYVYANSGLVPSKYTIVGNIYQWVSVAQNGVASPSVVTFTYAAPVVTATPSPTPAPRGCDVLVYYVTDSGVQLMQMTVHCDIGSNTIYANDYYVPGYSRIGSASQAVYVSASGVPSPLNVVFTYAGGSGGGTSVRTPPPITRAPATRTPAPTLVPVTDHLPATVKSNSTLNLRQERTTSSRILAVMPRGARVTVLNRASDWCLVEYNGITGYASTSYLEFDSDRVSAQVQVRYQTQNGTLLYTYSETCQQGVTPITCDTGRVNSMYLLQGAGTTLVEVDENGVATPAIVTFYFSEPPLSVSTPIPDVTVLPGGTLTVNGAAAGCNLYVDEYGETMVPLGELADVMGWSRASTQNGFTFSALGRRVNVVIIGQSANVTVDGKAVSLTSIEITSNSYEVYVRPTFFVKAFGARIDVRDTGVSLTITQK